MPRATVIIPNWNGASHLPTCLESLRQQEYHDFETIVVDNASQDDSLTILRERYPEVRVIVQPRNTFFCGAVNEGIRRSQSEFVVLLNNDVEVDARWLSSLIEAMDENPGAGMIASKILLFERRDVIHSAGDLYRRDGVPVNRGVWERDEGQYDEQRTVFGACGGAAAYRRVMLAKIGLFDEDLTMYCEDVDLAFRAQLAGYGCIFAPGAVVYHRLSATGGGPLASYYCGRNFISVVAKNMPSALLRRYWPGITGAQLGYLGESLWHMREPAARARLRGQLAGILSLPKMWRKRRLIQTNRRASDEHMASMLS